MPAVADLKWHAAAFLPLPVGRSSLDLPVDHHHRGEADEILLSAQIGDQSRQRITCWAAAARRNPYALTPYRELASVEHAEWICRAKLPASVKSTEVRPLFTLGIIGHIDRCCGRDGGHQSTLVNSMRLLGRQRIEYYRNLLSCDGYISFCMMHSHNSTGGSYG